MVHKRRIATTLLAGMTVEIANKIFPLVIIHYAQARLGLAAFGYTQFAIHLVDLAIPFIFLGYHQYGSIQIGSGGGADTAVSTWLGRLTVLKFINAVVVGALLLLLTILVPEYREYQLIVATLIFVLFTSALDTTYVYIGTQRMAVLSVLHVFAKSLSLALVLALVKDPNDAILYAAVTFGANGVISIGNLLLTLRHYPWRWPNFTSLGQTFKAALPLGLTGLAVLAVDRFDMFVAEARLGLVATGLYAGALRVMRSLQPFVHMLSNVFFSEMVAVRDQTSFVRHAELSLWGSLILTLPLAVGAWFVGGDLLALIIGPEYRSVGAVFAVLVAALVAEAFQYVLGQQVLLIKKDTKFLNCALIVGGVLGLVSSLVLVGDGGLLALAFTVLGAKTIAAALVTVRARVHLGKLPWREIGLAAGPAVVMGLALAALGREQHLAIKLSVGAGTYAAATFMVNRRLVTALLRNHFQKYF